MSFPAVDNYEDAWHGANYDCNEHGDNHSLQDIAFSTVTTLLLSSAIFFSWQYHSVYTRVLGGEVGLAPVAIFASAKVSAKADLIDQEFAWEQDLFLV